MTRPLHRRAFLAGTAASLLGSCASAVERSLNPLVRADDLGRAPSAERLLREAGLSGVVGYAVMDVASGQMLEERASAAALPPASVAKAITALYALDTLGADHRFETRLVATGPVEGGVVQGDLVLAGGGDPVLDTEALAALAGALAEAGVTSLTGAFRVWGGALPFARVIDRGQPDHVGYNPSVSGLNLNFNRVHFEWKRASGGYAVTMQARTANHSPDVAMARMRIADRAGPVYTYRDGGAVDEWSVAAGALGQRGARWLPVRKPELYAGEVFASLAGARGIALGAPALAEAAPQGRVLARLESPPLGALAADMLEFSTNLTAETLGLAASVARRPGVPDLAGSAREMTRWAKGALGMGANTRFVDHSGLGDSSRVTAGDMVRALRGAAGLRPLLKDIPLRDARGRPLADPPAEVRAKTGTLNFVSGLAGFARVGGDAGKERDLAFAIFVADTTRRAALDRTERERPPGARSYNAAAKGLQQRLLGRWGQLYAPA